MKRGSYVVYLKPISNLGDFGHKRDIWVISNHLLATNEVALQSISDQYKNFTTEARNLVSVKDLIAKGEFKKEYFNDKAFKAYQNLCVEFLKEKEANAKYASETIYDIENTIQVGDTMKGNNTMVTRTVSSNTDAVKVAAKIATGRTVNAVFTKQLVDRKLLPMMLRGYADSPLGAVVIANIVDFGVKQFAADNAKFAYVSDAMMASAMVDLLAEFDFEAIMNDVLSNVSLSELED